MTAICSYNAVILVNSSIHSNAACFLKGTNQTSIRLCKITACDLGVLPSFPKSHTELQVEESDILLILIKTDNVRPHLPRVQVTETSNNL